MSANNPTFEEVDKHIEAADLSPFQPGGRFHTARGAAVPQAVPQICPIYKIVRPIFLVVTNLPIPKKWKDAIKTFMEVLDALCP